MKATAPETRMIALAALRVAEWNARKTIDLETLAGLTESIKLHGVQVPLIVRPLSLTEYNPVADVERLKDGEELFEIVAGHRRFKASSLLKLSELPCIVRDLGDAAAREIGLIDNLQREDVPALEEAEAFGELLERLGSIPAVAARVGKEQPYIAKRLKLRTLTTWSRDAVREKLITIDHALLLARLAETEQNEALKWCLDRNAGVKVSVDKVLAARLQQGIKNANQYFGRIWEPETVQKLKEHIEDESGTPLDRAPWLLDDDSCGPICSECPKNTTANAPLFGDLDIGKPTCTDRACFTEKVAGFVRIQARTSAGSQTPLRVSWKATTKEPRMEIGEPCDGPVGLNNFTRVPNLAQTFKAGQWVEAKKKCSHTRPAVTVDWSDANDRGRMGSGRDLRLPGEIVQACIQPKCKAHPKAYETVQKTPQSSTESWEARQQREEEELAAFRAKENPVRRALYDAAAGRLTTKALLGAALVKGVDAYAVSLAVGLAPKSDYSKQVHGLIVSGSEQDLLRILLHSAFGRELQADRFHAAAKDKGRGDLRELAKVAGVDAAAIERKFDTPAKADPEKRSAKKAAKTPAKKAAAKKAVRKGGVR